MHRYLFLTIVLVVSIETTVIKCQKKNDCFDYEEFCDSVLSEVEFELTIEHASFFHNDSLVNTSKNIAFNTQSFKLHLVKGGEYSIGLNGNSFSGSLSVIKPFAHFVSKVSSFSYWIHH